MVFINMTNSFELMRKPYNVAQIDNENSSLMPKIQDLGGFSLGVV